MKKVIIASHGELSIGMLKSVTMIVGDLAKDVETYSLFPGESPNDYVCQKEAIISNSDDTFIFITDIKGGSVYNAIFTLTKYPNVRLFSGMNMPLVLEILLKQTRDMNQKEVQKVISNAKDAITYTSYIHLEIAYEEADDF